MPFFKRLAFFLFGLTLGIIFLVFFFKNKAKETGTEFCYLPNCRVLKDLRSKPYSYSDEVTAKLASGEIDSLEILTFFISGNVDFKNSDIKSKPCKTYLIHQETKNNKNTLKVANCPNKIIISSIQ